jgi:hypothetical protein
MSKRGSVCCAGRSHALSAPALLLYLPLIDELLMHLKIITRCYSLLLQLRLRGGPQVHLDEIIFLQCV